jgi:hypothetical protein
MAWAHDPIKPNGPMHPLVRQHSVVEDRARVDPLSLPPAGIRTGIKPGAGTAPPPSSEPTYDPALRIANAAILDEGLVAPAQPRHRSMIPVAGVSLAQTTNDADGAYRRAVTQPSNAAARRVLSFCFCTHRVEREIAIVLTHLFDNANRGRLFVEVFQLRRVVVLVLVK